MLLILRPHWLNSYSGSQYRAKNFISIISLKLHNPTRQVLLVAPFYRWSKSSSEK